MQEKHQSVASHTPQTGEPAHNPRMCPDWESNLQPSSSQAGTQPTQPGQDFFFKLIIWNYY